MFADSTSPDPSTPNNTSGAPNAPVPSLAEILAALDAQEDGEKNIQMNSANVQRPPQVEEPIPPIEPEPESARPVSDREDSPDLLSSITNRFQIFPLSANTLLKLPVLLGGVILAILYLFYRHWFIVFVWTAVISIILLALAGLVGRLLIGRLRFSRFWKVLAAIYLFLVFLLLASLLFWAFFRPPVIQARFDTHADGSALVTTRIRIKSNKPLWTNAQGSMTITPEVKGSWKPIRKLWLIPFTDEYIFEPEVPLAPETTYSLQTAALRDIFDTRASSAPVTFITSGLEPITDSVTDADVTDEDGAPIKPDDGLSDEELVITFSLPADSIDVNTDTPIKVTFPARMDVKSVQYEVIPETELEATWSQNEAELTLTPSTNWNGKVLYMIRLPGVSSTAQGQKIEREFVLQFTTASSTTPPDDAPPATEEEEEPAETATTPADEAPPVAEEDEEGQEDAEKPASPPASTPVTPPVAPPTTPPVVNTTLSKKLTRKSEWETALVAALKSKGAAELTPNQKANEVASAYCSDLADFGYRAGHTDSAGRNLAARLAAAGIQTETYIESLYIDYRFEASDVASRWITRDSHILSGRWNTGLCVASHEAGGVIAVMLFVVPK